MALLGSVAGILGGMGALMGFIEKNYEKHEIAERKSIKAKKIPINRRLKEYYRENLAAALPDTDSTHSRNGNSESDIFLEMPSQEV